MKKSPLPKQWPLRQVASQTTRRHQSLIWVNAWSKTGSRNSSRVCRLRKAPNLIYKGPSNRSFLCKARAKLFRRQATPSLHQLNSTAMWLNVIRISLSPIWHNKCSQHNQSIPALKWPFRSSSDWWCRLPRRYTQSHSPLPLRACLDPHFCRPTMRARFPDCSQRFKHSCNLSRKSLRVCRSSLDDSASQASRPPKRKRWSKGSP